MRRQAQRTMTGTGSLEPLSTQSLATHRLPTAHNHSRHSRWTLFLHRTCSAHVPLVPYQSFHLNVQIRSTWLARSRSGFRPFDTSVRANNQSNIERVEERPPCRRDAFHRVQWHNGRQMRRCRLATLSGEAESMRKREDKTPGFVSPSPLHAPSDRAG